VKIGAEERLAALKAHALYAATAELLEKPVPVFRGEVRHVTFAREVATVRALQVAPARDADVYGFRRTDEFHETSLDRNLMARETAADKIANEFTQVRGGFFREVLTVVPQLFQDILFGVPAVEALANENAHRVESVNCQAHRIKKNRPVIELFSQDKLRIDYRVAFLGHVSPHCAAAAYRWGG
jgi:hypothetical protein